MHLGDTAIKNVQSWEVVLGDKKKLPLRQKDNVTEVVLIENWLLRTALVVALFSDQDCRDEILFSVSSDGDRDL